LWEERGFKKGGGKADDQTSAGGTFAVRAHEGWGGTESPKRGIRRGQRKRADLLILVKKAMREKREGDLCPGKVAERAGQRRDQGNAVILVSIRFWGKIWGSGLGLGTKTDDLCGLKGRDGVEKERRVVLVFDFMYFYKEPSGPECSKRDQVLSNLYQVHEGGLGQQLQRTTILRMEGGERKHIEDIH